MTLIPVIAHSVDATALSIPPDTPITNAPMPDANMMQTSNSMGNLTEFGQILANRVLSENPGISNQDLYNRLKRRHRKYNDPTKRLNAQ